MNTAHVLIHMAFLEKRNRAECAFVTPVSCLGFFSNSKRSLTHRLVDTGAQMRRIYRTVKGFTRRTRVSLRASKAGKTQVIYWCPWVRILWRYIENCLPVRGPAVHFCRYFLSTHLLFLNHALLRSSTKHRRARMIATTLANLWSKVFLTVSTGSVSPWRMVTPGCSSLHYFRYTFCRLYQFFSN